MSKLSNRNHKVAKPKVQVSLEELEDTIISMQRFVETMIKDYYKGLLVHVSNDAKNLEFYLRQLDTRRDNLLKAIFKDPNKLASSRRAYRGRGYQDPCNSMSYSDYDDALEGLEECHDERIRENKVEDAFDFLQQLYDISDDFDFVDAMEEASSEYRLNSAEYELLKWLYDNEM